MLIIKKILILTILLAMISCYEGWEGASNKETNNKNDKPESPETPDTTKKDNPYSYILLEAFVLADELYNDVNCFTNTSIAIFKKNEFQERIDKLTESLKGITDDFTYLKTEIIDCTTLNNLKTSAINESPWGENKKPTINDKGKKALHFKAVFSEYDYDVEADANVDVIDWYGWLQLANEDIDTDSILYKVTTSNSSFGFINHWYEYTLNVLGGKNYTHEPTLMEDPTDEGIEYRSAIIAYETKEVVQWLLTN